ncbi:MAG: M13 family metallopeptidase [Candidatus Pacebacteria bacterium]|jgi:putative endopeptidase|nr:M13 family metallopeptidase [Candidatus Paceibacterota bacterium]
MKTTKNWGFDVRDLDTNVRPTDDFFHYSSGGWIKRNPIPATEAMWGSFSVLRQDNRKKLKIIVEEVSRDKNAKAGSEEQMVRDIYATGMDTSKRDRDGADPIMPILEKIRTIKKTGDIIPLMAYLHKLGFGGLFGFMIDQDERHNEKNIIYLGQSGLSLPDRDYYLKDDEDSKRVRVEYRTHVIAMFKLLGKTPKECAILLEAIMRIETELAKASMTRVELRDIEKQYNRRTLAKLAKEAPGIDWQKYFRLVGISNTGELIVNQPMFMKRAGELITEVSLDEWKAYFTWHVVSGSANFLGKLFVNEHFKFYSTVLSGVKKQRPEWEKTVAFIDGTVGEALGKLYVKKHFDHESKKKINELVDNLFAAYREHIEAVDWMSPRTKKLALKKLAAFKRKLGYPDKWKGYKGLTVRPDSYIENYWRVHEFEWKRELRKLKKKPDLMEWHMTPPTVNAYFNPVMNEIVFPAGVMQPPFFDAEADDAVNYGAIGSVIGHEITHGFDDQGRQFDGTGNFKNWWTDEDKKKFEEKAKVIEEQFNGYTAIDNMKVNGALTLGENIADLGGLTIAFTAFKKSQEGKDRKILDGFTPEQRFFLGYAMTEREQIRPELLKKIIVTDPHSPSIFRVNGPLSNMPEFIEAWGVKKGDKLYRKPEDRAKIW